MHVGLPNLDCGRPGRPVDPLKLQLALPEEVDQDVDADVDRRADQEEEQPHVNELRKIDNSPLCCIITSQMKVTINLGVGGFRETLCEDRHHGRQHKQGSQRPHKPDLENHWTI